MDRRIVRVTRQVRVSMGLMAAAECGQGENSDPLCWDNEILKIH